jgi:hypothetical protein
MRQRYVTEKQADSSFSDLGPQRAISRLREAEKRLASARPLMLIIIVTLLLCVAQNLASEASAFFVGMEPNAAILALGIFVLIVFRVWSVTAVESLRPGSQ